MNSKLVAAYVALGTGIGVTFSTASHLRTAALTLGTGSLALLAARVFHWRRRTRKHSALVPVSDVGPRQRASA